LPPPPRAGAGGGMAAPAPRGRSAARARTRVWSAWSATHPIVVSTEGILMFVEVIPDREALLLQLAAFAGNEPASSYLEVRPLKPWGPQEWFPVRDIRQVADAVMRLRGGHEVFLSVNPRTARVGKAEHVARSWCLLADCDTPLAVERLRRFKQ